MSATCSRSSRPAWTLATRGRARSRRPAHITGAVDCEAVSGVDTRSQVGSGAALVPFPAAMAGRDRAGFRQHPREEYLGDSGGRPPDDGGSLRIAPAPDLVDVGDLGVQEGPRWPAAQRVQAAVSAAARRPACRWFYALIRLPGAAGRVPSPAERRAGTGVSSFGPQVQVAKSWLVAISAPRMAENPTEAVRERITVPAGCFSAAELAMPSVLIFSAVSTTISVVPSRSCHTSARVIQGMGAVFPVFWVMAAGGVACTQPGDIIDRDC